MVFLSTLAFDRRANVLTIKKEGPMYLAMCGKVVVFRSLDKANVLHYVQRWNNVEEN